MSYEQPIKDDSCTFKQCLMEGLGTFALCYVGGWSVMMNDLGHISITGVAIAHMFVLGFMIWAGAGISGAHYNGAVTLALLTSGHIGVKKWGGYIGSQFAGSLLAGILLIIMKSGYTLNKDSFTSQLGYPHADYKVYGLFTCFLAEIVATFFLVFMVYATAISSTKPKSEVYGLTIGGALGMAILSIGPMTGAALNPWRVVGPAIISLELFNMSKFSYAWIYYIGCPLGAFLCSLFWRYTIMSETKADTTSDAIIPATGNDEDEPINA